MSDRETMFSKVIAVACQFTKRKVYGSYRLNENTQAVAMSIKSCFRVKKKCRKEQMMDRSHFPLSTAHSLNLLNDL